MVVDLAELAMAAYTTYGDYLDNEQLAWIELPEDERGAWMAAASRVAELLRLED